MIDFDKFKDKSPEDQALEFYVCLSNLERMQRKIAQDTSNILELLTAKKTEKEIKAEFKTPIVDKPVTETPAAQPPAREPEPEQPEETKTKPELPEKGKYITVQGTLMEDPVQREVDTSRGPTNITNCKMDSQYGVIRVGVWGEKGDELMVFSSGDHVKMTSMRVNDPYDDTPQLSSARHTEISIF